MAPTSQSSIVLVAVVVVIAATVGPAVAMGQSTSPSEESTTGFDLDVNATSATPDGTVVVDFSLTNNRSSQAVILNLTAIPDGWTVDDQDGDGGTWREGGTSWLWQTVDADETVQPTVELAVPANATPGEYSMNVEVKANSSTDVEEVPLTVDSPLTVSASADPTTPNASTTVSYTVENSGSSTASALLNVTEIPENWSVSETTDDGGTWNGNDTAWFWQSIGPNGSVSPSVTVSIPENESTGDYTVVAELKRSDSVVDRSNVTVAVNENQSVKDAVAGSDGEIDDFELLDAVDHWRNGDPVPGAAKAIGDFELLDLIDDWRS